MLPAVDEHVVGLTNLSEFVAATAGRTGEVARLPGGVVVASPFPMAHGFVTAGFRTAPDVPAATFLAAATDWFAERARPWVLWAPTSDDELGTALTDAGGPLDGTGSPAMIVRDRVTGPSGFTVSYATDADSGAVFGALAEAGYGIDGMGWLMLEHDSFTVPAATWAMVTADDDPGTGPISVACGYLHGTTGGVYYVATPDEHRGKGAAAAVTAAVTNALFDQGAELVTLQATELGHPVYRRLGYTDYDAFRSCELGGPPAG
jgi:GNAT superfamily N-acetyltransferase